MNEIDVNNEYRWALKLLFWCIWYSLDESSLRRRLPFMACKYKRKRELHSNPIY